MKKQQSPEPPVVAKNAVKKEKDDSAEKQRIENERRKIREEGMKKWREKWNQRDAKDQFNIKVEDIYSADVKTRNHIEQAKHKPVA